MANPRSPLNEEAAAHADVAKIEALRESRAVPEHHARAVFRHQLPTVLPAQWEMVMEGPDGRAYRCTSGLTFIVSLAIEDDGKQWLHFSIAHPERLPTYEELTDAKDLFCGRETKAVMIIPPRSQHVNIHRNCLHFFRCLESDGLPDFTSGTKSL